MRAQSYVVRPADNQQEFVDNKRGKVPVRAILNRTHINKGRAYPYGLKRQGFHHGTQAK